MFAAVAAEIKQAGNNKVKYYVVDLRDRTKVYAAADQVKQEVRITQCSMCIDSFFDDIQGLYFNIYVVFHWWVGWDGDDSCQQCWCGDW